MIYAVEPQCAGFVHERFNAALLATIGRALPGEEIAFWAEESHAHCVIGCTARSRTRLALTQRRPLDLAWPANARARLKLEEELCRKVLQESRVNHARAVVFCSASSLTLIALKRLLAGGAFDGPVAAVPHAVLAGVRRRTRRIWNRGIDIVSALRMPAPPNLRLVALSRSIREAMAQEFPGNDWRHVDHPYLFGGAEKTARSGNPLHIGIFGGLRHRIEDYVRLLRGVLSPGAPVRFTLLGHISSQGEAARELAQFFPEAGQGPIPGDRFDEVGPTIDYSLNISDPDYHRLVASATLLDSFNYLAPVLSLDNALFDEYRASMGDVGDSFASVAHMVEGVRALASGGSSGRRQRQAETICRERSRFSPEFLAGTFRLVVQP